MQAYYSRSVSEECNAASTWYLNCTCPSESETDTVDLMFTQFVRSILHSHSNNVLFRRVSPTRNDREIS